MSLLTKWLQPKAAAAEHRTAADYLKDGNRMLAEGRLEAATARYEAAAAADPSNLGACVNLGYALKELGQTDRAGKYLSKAVQIDPLSVDANYLLGLVREIQGDADGACRHLHAAVTLKPDFAIAWRDFCRVAFQAGKIETARWAAEQGLAANAQLADLHYYLGNICFYEQAYQDAVASYDRALAIDPEFAQAYSNRGLALQEMKRLDAALASFDKAIALEPDNPEPHWNQALCRLLMEDFERGWVQYEWRWRIDSHEKRRDYGKPLWLGGEPLQGTTILLYAEQGLGDTIQFCRYAPQLAALGAHVVLEVPKALAPLLEGLDGVKVIARGSQLPAFDYCCPLLSLPMIFKTDTQNIPGAPYLKAAPEKLAAWQAVLGERRRPRVGLVWSGSAGNTKDRHRSVSLERIKELLIDGVDYYCLQKEIRPDDRKTLELLPGIHRLDRNLGDFSDTAALVDLMDVVIAVDTSVAHLAGAMGKDVWVMLAFVADWRWFLDRDDSPWYCSARLFRQQSSGDWSGVLREVRAALHERFVNGRAG